MKLVAAVLLAIALPVAAQRPAQIPTRYLSTQQLKALEAEIEGARQQWEVPGLAVAIVQGDSVVMAKGFGVKELGKTDKVDENTLFAIGSSGKSMTAALVSMLVDDGKMRLDDPVWHYLPNFKVADPYVSREATIRDILSHRTGVENATAPWYGASLSRAELIDRFRFLGQAAPFRTRLVYNNLMLMAAGEAAAAAAKTDWETLIRDRLFIPLGMRSSVPGPHMLPANANVATPHTPVGGKLAPIPHRQTRNIGPAGAQYSSARDMAQYLRLQLGNGMYDGKRLISERSIAQMRSITTAPHAQLLINDSTTVGMGYGLGWFTELYRGKRLLRHGGAIDGMLTEMMFLPEDQIGVVILTNRSPHTMHTALTNHIFDIALGLPPRDWNARAFANMKAGETRAAEQLKTLETNRIPNAPPSLSLEKYAGTYSDSLGGTIRIAHENNALMLRYHEGFVARLEPWHYNTFRVQWQNSSLIASPSSFAPVFIDHPGRASEVRIDVLGTFRAPPAPGGRGGRGGGAGQ